MQNVKHIMYYVFVRSLMILKFNKIKQHILCKIKYIKCKM